MIKISYRIGWASKRANLADDMKTIRSGIAAIYAVTGTDAGNINTPITSAIPEMFLVNVVYLLAEAGIYNSYLMSTRQMSNVNTNLHALGPIVKTRSGHKIQSARNNNIRRRMIRETFRCFCHQVTEQLLQRIGRGRLSNHAREKILRDVIRGRIFRNELVVKVEKAGDVKDDVDAAVDILDVVVTSGDSVGSVFNVWHKRFRGFCIEDKSMTSYFFACQRKQLGVKRNSALRLHVDRASI